MPLCPCAPHRTRSEYLFQDGGGIKISITNFYFPINISNGKRCGVLQIVGRVVDITDFGATPERRSVIARKRKLALQTLWQIGIRREKPAECDQVGVAIFDDRFGAIAVEPARRDDGPFEYLAQKNRGDRCLIFVQYPYADAIGAPYGYKRLEEW
jgi:hypothetical protein